MTIATDQKIGPDHPSLTTRRMLELREAVLEEWEKRVRASVKSAASLTHPLLINTIPSLYHNIAEALTPDYPRTSASAVTPSVASEHGGERARLTNYEVHAVICEYQILRSAIVDVLKRNNVQLRDDEVYIISSAIDNSIRESVTAFTLAQAAFREQFVAALAHDLRNPLAAATTAAQLISLGMDLEKTHGYAHIITENLKRMDQMIQDMLDTAIFQSGERLPLHPSHFDIAHVVTEVCKQYSAAHGPRFEILGTSVKGWWDRGTLKRALENLVSNALKYGAPDQAIRIGFEESHERMQLSVHNEGEPIPLEQLEDIFQVFRRAKAAKEGGKRGWGIGLPFVRSVAESHGGSIGVESTKERGTTFIIDIPVDARPFQNAPTLE